MFVATPKMRKRAEGIEPIYQELIHEAAQGEVL
jgi:hypothetical protein